MNANWLWGAMLLAACCGCGDSGTNPASATNPAAAPNPGAAAPTAPAGGPPAPLPPPPPPVREVASEDMTKKGIAGKELGKGILATPASVYLRIPDRLVFQGIQHALNLYKGTNGEFPKTHEEFMREIIQANNIQLPELPDGDKYVYDPEKAELMIEQKPR